MVIINSVGNVNGDPMTQADVANLFGKAWVDIIKDRKVISVTAADFGMGEECVCLMQFQVPKTGDNPLGFLFEVGVGEAMRPYRELYKGDSINKASMAFLAEAYTGLAARVKIRKGKVQ